MREPLLYIRSLLYPYAPEPYHFLPFIYSPENRLFVKQGRKQSRIMILPFGSISYHFSDPVS